MKKRLLGYALMLICSVGFIASCDKDDDSTDYAKEIVGTYKGLLTVEIPSFGSGADSSQQKIILSYTAQNKVKMSLRNFTFNSVNVGDIIVDNVSVSKLEDVVYILPTTASVSLNFGEPVNVTVGVSGEVTGKNLNLSIAVSDAPAVDEVDVKFFGTKLDVEESNVALITSMTFSDSVVVGQPVISGTNIVFQIVDTALAEQLTSLTPTIIVSAGASVYPASDVPQDFSQGSVTYTVTAQDSLTKTEYTVSYQRLGKYDFETWFEANPTALAAYIYIWLPLIGIHQIRQLFF